MIYDNILKTIGSTPIVKLNSIGSHLECTLFAKLELFNPGGSVKDRIALEMVECAEKNGRIKKKLYEKFAEIGIGRTSIIYATK